MSAGFSRYGVMMFPVSCLTSHRDMCNLLS